MDIRVGTCGWAFDDWRGAFYPPGTGDQLVHYATQFNNQFEGHSPDTARKLLALLGKPTAERPPRLFE